MRPGLWLVLIGLALAPGVAEAACAQDGDCRGTRLCRQGRCVDAPCDRHEACRPGLVCRNRRCVPRSCISDMDCPVERSCVEGLCALPQPPRLRGAPAPPRPSKAAAPTGVVTTVGPSFPFGALVAVDLDVGARRLTLGLGAVLPGGGLAWSAGFAGALLRGGPWSLDALVTIGGQVADASAGGGAAGLLLGSGRRLFAPGRRVAPVWAGPGVGVSWRHGPGRARELRLEATALVLLGDRYPADADYPVIPGLSLRYGVAW